MTKKEINIGDVIRTPLISKHMGKPVMVSVKVQDIKISYGKTRYLISPVDGSGEVWVEIKDYEVV